MNHRIGCVSYLNARPLISAAQCEITLDHPAPLSAALARGELDAALVPVIEWFIHPEYKAVDAVAIACRGPVYSVFLATIDPLESLQTVWLDASSRTSNHLLQTLMRNFSGVKFLVADAPRPPKHGEGVLLIGDHAIAFRRKRETQFIYHDLGEWWMRETGLPFVFALWLIGPGVSRPDLLAAELRAMAQRGKSMTSRIFSDTPDPEFASAYLTDFIRHELKQEEKCGIVEFRSRLIQSCLIPDSPVAALEWV